MPALITELIDKLDNLELIRDQLGAILKVESSAQQALALAANRDAKPWDLRVYVERTAPWEQWLDMPAEDDVAPIVAVSFENDTSDQAGSSAVQLQRTVATFNIDCYGYGVATETADGHEPGDLRATAATHRAVRMVRNILMAGHYTYLAMRGVVGKRYFQGKTMFVPEFDSNAAQQIVACRMNLQVEFNEYTPQVIAEPLELLTVEVKRDPSGEVLLTAEYGDS